MTALGVGNRDTDVCLLKTRADVKCLCQGMDRYQCLYIYSVQAIILGAVRFIHKPGPSHIRNVVLHHLVKSWSVLIDRCPPMLGLVIHELQYTSIH